MRHRYLLLGLLLGTILSAGAQYSPQSGRLPQMVTVPFSATPVYDASTGSTFKITLTGNVTSSTFTNAKDGMTYTFHICQDGTGLHSHAWPASFKTAGLIAIPGTALASTCSTQQIIWNGTLSAGYPVALGILNQ